MTRAELIREWGARRLEAERHGATAPLARTYAIVLEELRTLDGAPAGGSADDHARGGKDAGRGHQDGSQVGRRGPLRGSDEDERSRRVETAGTLGLRARRHSGSAERRDFDSQALDGGRHRWVSDGGRYADLRDFADVGGGLEALKAPRERYATTDEDEASQLLAKRLEQLEEARRGRRPDGREDRRLAEYAKRHLKLKEGNRRASSIRRNDVALRRVLAFFGEDVRLSEIDVAGLTDSVGHRRRQPGNREGSKVSAQSILHELNALGNLYKRAVSEEVADRNPVRLLSDKPTVRREEAAYLEGDEAARLLEAAAHLDKHPSGPRAIRFLHPVLAAFLYTGARAKEVFGMEVTDLDFKEELVHIRPNAWRNLKHHRHRRHVPLWPDLRAVLTGYVERCNRTEGLVFPSPNGGGMLKDLRGSLAAALEHAEITKAVTLHSLRHTYTATRLQTLDHGAPVSVYTVMKELGHRSIGLIESTYGHLTSVRHRSAAVEYRKTEVLELAARRAESA